MESLTACGHHEDHPYEHHGHYGHLQHIRAMAARTSWTTTTVATSTNSKSLHSVFLFTTGARHGLLHRLLLQQQRALEIVEHPVVGWHVERRWGRPVGHHWGHRQRQLGRPWPLGAALSAQARRAHARVRHEVHDVAIAQTSPEVHDVHDVRDVQTNLLWCTYLRD